jgi:hypothetical protein
MKTIATAMSITLGFLCAPALAAGGDAASARTTDRSPQQVAALVRGVAAGNEWRVLEEVALRDGEVIAIHLCEKIREGDRAVVCGQFTILGNDRQSEIMLLHVGTRLPAPVEGSDQTSTFIEVLDAASASAIARAEDRFRCDANGCP